MIGRLGQMLGRRAAPDEAELLREPWRRAYAPAATKADILACFRLLLGRNPHPEEWTGHSMHVGEPLDGVVASYLRSLEFSRRGLMAPEVSGEVVVSNLPAFKIYSDRGDGAVGKFVRDDNYEPDVTAVFRRLLKPGMTVIDIGANIGYFSMLSAAVVGAAGQVFAIEPNQRNVALLEASRRLNGFGQITVVPVAAGAETGILALHTSHSTGTTSVPPEEIAALLAARIVPCLALDSIFPGIPPDRRIDLIKIDVDGAEYRAMLGAQAMIRRHRPAIISEFAPDLMPGISGISGEDYLRWFGAQGFDVSVIEPDGSLAAMGQDWIKVMAAYDQRGIDHIDILATPKQDQGAPPPETPAKG